MPSQPRNPGALRLPLCTVAICCGALAVLSACGAASAPAPDFSEVRERASRSTGTAQPRAATAGAARPARTADRAPSWDPSDPNLILGFGEGPTLDAARSSAVAQVARQVRSELVASFSIDTQGTLDASDTRVREEISERATFDRTDLIATDASSATCDRGVCRVTAVLDRATALAQLSDELGQALGALDSAVIALEAASAASDAAVPWSRASGAWQALEPSLPLLDAIAAGTSGISRDARELWSVANDRVTALIDVTPAYVRVAESGTAVDEAGSLLEGALRDAWAALGGSISAACVGVELVLSPQVECARGFVGSQCALRGDVELRACARSSAAPVVLARAALDRVVVSAHPSSEERARANLLRDLASAPLDAWLVEAFGSVWPFL